jgi:hypothetical protein
MALIVFMVFMLFFSPRGGLQPTRPCRGRTIGLDQGARSKGENIIDFFEPCHWLRLCGVRDSPSETEALSGFCRSNQVWCARGAAKKNRRTPPVHLLNLRPTHPPSDFFFLTCFFSTFLGVSRQGEFKNTIKIFWQKVRVENFSQNFDKNFDVSFSSTSFVLSHFRVFLSDGSSKALQKPFCKKIVSKSFYKKFDQKSKTDFFSIFF